MIKVIGVRFRTAGKIYFFDPLQYEIKKGDNVIVETARGIEFGTAVSDVREVTDDKVVQLLKPVLRIANERDREQEAANKLKEKHAFKICLEKIQKHGLEMKLIDAEYTFDNNKVLFYFTADGRIDFRELVKDLASVFKTRIELRQIGVRDETKILGGIGICGRPLCCHTHLSDFIPVSIKMAKEQNLSLNPTKISGVCGRLMCCLKHEEDTYEELNRRLPNIGDHVTTEDGLKGEVQSVNVLRQLVKVIVDKDDEKEIIEYPVESLRFRRHHGKKEQMELSREELQELERMEQEDQLETQEHEERDERQDARTERNEVSEKSASQERREWSERQDRSDRREKTGREKHREYGERQQEGSERQRREQRGERNDRERGQNRRSRYDRNERNDGNSSRERNTERREYQNRSERREYQDRSERREYQDRSEHREYQDRSAHRDRNETREHGDNRRRNDYRRNRQGNRQRREQRSDQE